MRSHLALAVSGLFFLAGGADEAAADEPLVVEPPGLSPTSIDEDCGQLPPTADERPRTEPSQTVADPQLPHGRAVGRLTAEACTGLLRSLGVSFDEVAAEGGSVSAVEQPIRLRGPLGGLAVRAHGGDERSIHSILDCRLAVALYAWAPELRAAGFVGIEHVSVFRPGARVARSGHVSGHAHALAIDALRFVRADGTTFSVLDDWVARERGADPCAHYDEPDEARALRDAICRGAASEWFEVVVTPHHDDLHANHVHLEVVPGVDWTAIR